MNAGLTTATISCFPGTDQLADEDVDKPNVARTVTVEVTPEEAQRVALAQEAGTLSLTLRNLATTAKPDLRALSVNELTGSATKPNTGRAAQTVTIIRAGQRSTETFHDN